MALSPNERPTKTERNARTQAQSHKITWCVCSVHPFDKQAMDGEHTDECQRNGCCKQFMIIWKMHLILTLTNMKCAQANFIHTRTKWLRRKASRDCLHPFCMTAFWHNINAYGLVIRMHKVVAIWQQMKFQSPQQWQRHNKITDMPIAQCSHSTCTSHNSNCVRLRCVCAGIHKVILDRSSLFTIVIRANHPERSQVCK